jgi:hypothetical protein
MFGALYFDNKKYVERVGKVLALSLFMQIMK